MAWMAVRQQQIHCNGLAITLMVGLSLFTLTTTRLYSFIELHCAEISCSLELLTGHTPMELTGRVFTMHLGDLIE
jgi:hypothetical protein